MSNIYVVDYAKYKKREKKTNNYMLHLNSLPLHIMPLLPLICLALVALNKFKFLSFVRKQKKC